MRLGWRLGIVLKNAYAYQAFPNRPLWLLSALYHRCYRQVNEELEGGGLRMLIAEAEGVVSI